MCCDVFRAICEANGLPKLRLYDLRHTHASLLIHEGVHPKKISERLGHSSIKLTMDTYGHSSKAATATRRTRWKSSSAASRKAFAC